MENSGQNIKNCSSGSREKKWHQESFVVCLFVVTPPLPRDEGTAQMAVQVHAVNLIEIRLRERWQPISN